MRPASSPVRSSRSIVAVSAPAKRELSASTSAAVHTGAVSITSMTRAASAMAQRPDRRERIGRFLIFEREPGEGGSARRLVELAFARQRVEAAAPQEHDLVDQHVTLRAQLARITSLAEDTS